MDVLTKVATTDQFFVQQQFAPLVNRYRISTVGSDGKSPGEFLCQVQQKRLKIRERITFYADEARQVPVLELRARSIMEFRGMVDVVLPSGEAIGVLRKVFGASLLRSTWELQDPNGAVVATAQESSLPIAILRRIWGLIPYVGDVPFLLPFHFDISALDGRPLGRYQRIWSIRDRYILDLTGDPARVLDRRVAMAFTVALDALQDR
ncbi:MAG: hypothetical protein M3O55_08085 [Actinomycetota bacterium]|nr:hypothetical protein [Actinomycetota bacterium]